jgi:Flp pilus assembly secretin CpaC
MLWPAAALAQSPGDIIAVNVDQAKLFKLPGKVATIVIGNPMIADVTLQTGGLVVVTGKGYGATNFIAMDRSGEVMVDHLIEVRAPADKVVTVYRGIERQTLSCTPLCENRVTLGDADKYFNSALGQVGALSNQAITSAAVSGRTAN